MDGVDFSSIDQIDQDIFDASQSDSEECDEMPLPDCIGLDSALQDDERARVESEKKRIQPKNKSRTEEERDLELSMLKTDSIRRQMLENSMSKSSSRDPNSTALSMTTRSHVMNITEKAGMSGIDKDKINQIIHEASKNSLFYKRQAQRQAEILKSIEKMLNRIKSATPAQIENARITCDKLVKELERQRIFNRVIVHFDLDMFFAAVEIRDNPELADKPVAVGGDSMVSTSNYIARKFGVRAAMPGFIAKKLCPDLILIKPKGFKYREASSEVFAILEQYDPELTGMSLDEAYLDLTDYVKNTLERDNLEHQEYYDGTLPTVWWTRASEVVEEIRQAIFDKTKLTCSAGIACNTLLAKISTDINKPNGQFMVQGYPRDVIDFISKTPVEKVSGIGKVSVQFLNALKIKTCGDIFEKRHFLPLVFYEINVKFYLRVSLGDGSTSIKSDEQRKSKSVERTFSAVKDTLILLDKLDSICEELCTRYLKPYRIRGRTVTVKLKRNTFMTTTKSYSMLVPTNDKLVVYSAAKNLLLSEIANEPPEISYRLLGVKLSNLADDGVTTNQLTIDAMLRNQEMGKTTKSETSVHQVDFPTTLDNSNDMIAELVTQQEDSYAIMDAVENDEHRIDKNQGQKAETTKSERHAGSAKIDSFFCKHQAATTKTTETNERISSKNHSGHNDNGVVHTNDDGDDKFFDAASPIHFSASNLNEASQQEQAQNEPQDDDFQCPYCFKSYADFTHLERHVDSCNLKIPIDVNRSFFSPSAHKLQQSSASAFFSQFKPGGARSHPAQSSSQSVRKSTRLKRHSRKTSPSSTSSTVALSQMSSQSCDKPSLNASGKKMSYFERFMESNSQSLKQSVKVEPLHCPYCAHGFLNFSSLESHVVMCTKKK